MIMAAHTDERLENRMHSVANHWQRQKNTTEKTQNL